MKIVLSWLRDSLALKPTTTTQNLMDGLVQLGHEVEGVEDSGKTFAHVVIGHVLERVQHPNADRLGVCQVDVGEKAPRTIVCGAPNARAGITVAVALPGAVLPGDFKIAKSDKRGIASDGMICSLDELGMGGEHDGIWEMDTQAKPGTPLTDVLGSEVILDVSVTPNRGDCLSHLGMARDLATLDLGTLKLPEAPAKISGKTKLKIEEPEASVCPWFTAVEIHGVDATKPSPQLVQQRLTAAGLKPHNAIVDVTNYVMLALGQPLHAYDADQLQHGLKADVAKPGEVFEGLNDVKLTLTGHEPVIRDGSQIVGLAGMLGGAHSGVTESTKNVLLEAAYFNNVAISLAGQKHQLITDARSRFERGVDPAMTAIAVQIAAHLLVQWAGGKLIGMSTAGKLPAAPESITYNPAFFESFIGLALPEKRQQDILESLGFTVKASKTGWSVTPPTWRTYMSTPEDLTEEILRVEGYDKVKPILPPTLPGQFQVDGRAITLDRTTRKALAANGFLEVMTYSFIPAADAALATDVPNPLNLANPLVENMTVMRPSLLPGLLRALQTNVDRKENTPWLAEVGKIYTASSEALSAAGVIANLGGRHWLGKDENPTPFTAKGLGEAVLTTLGAPISGARVTPGAGAFYHPGQSGTWQVGPFTLGRFGLLHPKITKALGLTVPVAAFELDIETLLKLQSKTRPFTANPYPPVQRDLALVIDSTLPAATLQATLQNADRDLVKSVELFDQYSGTGIPAGKKSLAFSLTLQANDRTLTQAEIEATVAKAAAAAQEKHQATLRA